MCQKWYNDVGFLIGRAQRALCARIMAELEPFGITYGQYRVLCALWEEEDISQVALADRLHTDKTSLARMLDRMQKAGLIVRATDQGDSRVKRVMLTPAGRALQNRVVSVHDQSVESALDGMSESEREELKRLLNRIYDHVCGVRGDDPADRES